MKRTIKEIISAIPIVGSMARRVYGRLRRRGTSGAPFIGSSVYWDRRYASGGNSGVGSYAFFAEFKAEVLNDFVTTHDVRTVIEFGCGDGNQLRLAKYPSYLGFDVSTAAILRCQEIFRLDQDKSFRLMSEYGSEKADLTLSLDVIYHLVEDQVFEHYILTLFAASSRYVIIYSSDFDGDRREEGAHVRHRRFTPWIQRNLQGWALISHLPNRYPYRGDYKQGSFAEFFIYERDL
jgi:hypothetical protein